MPRKNGGGFASLEETLRDLAKSNRTKNDTVGTLDSSFLDTLASDSVFKGYSGLDLAEQEEVTLKIVKSSADAETGDENQRTHEDNIKGLLEESTTAAQALADQDDVDSSSASALQTNLMKTSSRPLTIEDYAADDQSIAEFDTADDYERRLVIDEEAAAASNTTEESEYSGTQTNKNAPSSTEQRSPPPPNQQANGATAISAISPPPPPQPMSIIQQAAEAPESETRNFFGSSMFRRPTFFFSTVNSPASNNNNDTLLNRFSRDIGDKVVSEMNAHLDPKHFEDFVTQQSADDNQNANQQTNDADDDYNTINNNNEADEELENFVDVVESTTARTNNGASSSSDYYELQTDTNNASANHNYGGGGVSGGAPQQQHLTPSSTQQQQLPLFSVIANHNKPIIQAQQNSPPIRDLFHAAPPIGIFAKTGPPQSSTPPTWSEVLNQMTREESEAKKKNASLLPSIISFMGLSMPSEMSIADKHVLEAVYKAVSAIVNMLDNVAFGNSDMVDEDFSNNLKQIVTMSVFVSARERIHALCKLVPQNGRAWFIASIGAAVVYSTEYYWRMSNANKLKRKSSYTTDSGGANFINGETLVDPPSADDLAAASDFDSTAPKSKRIKIDLAQNLFPPQQNSPAPSAPQQKTMQPQPSYYQQQQQQQQQPPARRFGGAASFASFRLQPPALLHSPEEQTQQLFPGPEDIDERQSVAGYEDRFDSRLENFRQQQTMPTMFNNGGGGSMFTSKIIQQPTAKLSASSFSFGGNGAALLSATAPPPPPPPPPR